MNSQNRLTFKIAKSSLNTWLPIYWSSFDTFFVHKINLIHPEKEEKRMKLFFPFFENFDRDFGTLSIEIAKTGFQIWTRHLRIRFYANFCEFSCVISLKNNQLACFFGHPVINVNVYETIIFGPSASRNASCFVWWWGKSVSRRTSLEIRLLLGKPRTLLHNAPLDCWANILSVCFFFREGL